MLVKAPDWFGLNRRIFMCAVHIVFISATVHNCMCVLSVQQMVKISSACAKLTAS